MQVDVGSFEESARLPFAALPHDVDSGVRSFIRRRGAGAAIVFAPELLSARIFYARETDGRKSPTVGSSPCSDPDPRDCMAAARISRSSPARRLLRTARTRSM